MLVLQQKFLKSDFLVLLLGRKIFFFSSVDANILNNCYMQYCEQAQKILASSDEKIPAFFITKSRESPISRCFFFFCGKTSILQCDSKTCYEALSIKRKSLKKILTLYINIKNLHIYIYICSLIKFELCCCDSF